MLEFHPPGPPRHRLNSAGALQRRLALPLLLIVLLALPSLAQADGNDPACAVGLPGATGDIRLISTEAHIISLTDFANRACWRHGITLRQTADITLTGPLHGSIGYNIGSGASPDNVAQYFSADYDGGGFAIFGLILDRPNDDIVGLFGRIAGEDDKKLAIVRNLTIGSAENPAQVSGSDVVGVLTPSMMDGKVENVHVFADVVGRDVVGGVFGSLDYNSVVMDVTFTGSVAGRDDVGGLAGKAIGSGSTNDPEGISISDVVVDVALSATGDRAGGLVGSVVANSTGEDRYGVEIVGAVVSGSINPSPVLITWEMNLVGGLVGQLGGGLVQDSTANVEVRGYRFLGGLVGRILLTQAGASVLITGSSATGNVASDRINDLDFYIGGLIGLVGDASDRVGTVRVVESFASGNVVGARDVGGLIGYAQHMNLIVDRSYATGDALGTGNHIGGLIGYFNDGSEASATITDSFATGDVSGNDYVGGLMGKAYDTVVRRSFATGNASGTDYVGGLMGSLYTRSMMEDSFAWGNAAGIRSGSDDTGGLIGKLRGAVVHRSYSIGVTTGVLTVGGLIGRNGDEFTPPVSVTDSFWDTETSGLLESVGGIGLSTSDMQTLATYQDAGWSVAGKAGENVWTVCSDAYPILTWVVLLLDEGDDSILNAAAKAALEGVCSGDQADVPAAPSDVVAVAGDASAEVSWVSPSDDGGSTILGYTVTAHPGGATCSTTAATSCTVSGLTNGTAYTFTVVASNEVGDSEPSTPSEPVTPMAVASLAAPANVFVTPDDGRAWLLFTAPAGAVEGYEWQFTDDPQWTALGLAVSFPVPLTGLENDEEYCVQVRALAADAVPGAASEATCFTPSISAAAVPEAALDVASPDEVFELRPVDGVANLVMAFTLDSTGDDTLVDAWVNPRGFVGNAQVTAMVPEEGRGTITQYGSRWFWKGVNLEPGGSAGGSLTIRLEVP